MKNQLAVFTNGYSARDTGRALEGMYEYAKKLDADIHVFSCYAAYDESDLENKGQLSIYDLADLNSYDGIIVLSNFLNSTPKVYELFDRIKAAGVPAVSIGIEIEGFPYIGIDNESGMREVVTHLVEKHDVKRIAFLGGTEDHPDSRVRLEVTKEVLSEHGYGFDDKDLYYCLWSNEPSEEAVHDMISRPEGLPDAIVAANDIMCIAASTELVRLGYKIPDDVIVTGFDHRIEADMFYPGVTTVEPDYHEIGYRSCKTLYDMVAGKKTKMRYMSPTTMVMGESCGCSDNGRCLNVRNEFCQKTHLSIREERRFNRNVSKLRLIILNSNNYKEMRTGITRFYEKDHSMEGDNFAVVINKRYLDKVMLDDKSVLSDGYKNKMEVMVAFRDGKPIDLRSGNKRLIPGYTKEKGKAMIFYFFPLHIKQYSCGYVVLNPDIPLFNKELRIYDYLTRLENTFVEYRINTKLNILNMELTSLYDKDPMTGLYNRFCYEEKVRSMLDRSRVTNLSMMVMFIDINNMKIINDEYGHLYGDKAICLVADAIKNSINDESLGVRFGGDEFLLAAPNYGEAEAEQIKKKINDYIEDKNSSGLYPFTFTVSCGYVITDPESDRSIQDYVNKADEIMYEIKRIYHEEHTKAGRR
ncbi:MAG: GGDEF domain-containing protein [Lachnospiraceae bacterium]|nr:GGDEF domain-containing protein [Lachnospiraceae bacterium]